jgi:hypothetical protein
MPLRRELFYASSPTAALNLFANGSVAVSVWLCTGLAQSRRWDCSLAMDRLSSIHRLCSQPLRLFFVRSRLLLVDDDRSAHG